MKKALIGLLLFIVTAQAHAQLTRYIIQFTDKANNPYTLSSPAAAYLSPQSLERRSRHSIVIDSADLPVTPAYIDSVRLAGEVTILNASKWLNSVSIHTTDAEALQKILQFPFVKRATPIATRQTMGVAPADKGQLQKMGIQSISKTLDEPFDYGAAREQIQIHNGDFLHNLGLRGQGMRIGMLDAGYYNYTSLRAFDSMNKNGQVLQTWDFVARHASVTEDHPHGMQCLSVMAANIPSQFVGSAPKASFYLYRTEDVSSEFPIEEHNWVCGAERVDSAGGQIISSSLGYGLFDDAALNHTYAQMNGNTTMAAIGADLAAKKGLLVVVAAGNEGDAGWKYIMTPADGDSVLTVGAVDKAGNIAGFSSYGPSADGQVKPDVVSVGAGTILQNTDNTIGSGNGTSLATPNMAGLAACLWQGFPEAGNMRIIQALRQASSQYTTPDDRKGYGIPDLKKAFIFLLKENASFAASYSNCGVNLAWSSKDAGGMRYEIERKTAADAEFRPLSQLVVPNSTFNARSYQFSDVLADQPTGAIQYRIRQVVDTATAAYTAIYIDTVTVNVVAACNRTAKPLLIFPNPTRSQAMLQVNNTEAITDLRIEVRDAAGRLVYRSRENKPAGIAVYPVYLPHLSKAKYFVSVYNGTKLLATETLLKL